MTTFSRNVPWLMGLTVVLAGCSPSTAGLPTPTTAAQPSGTGGQTSTSVPSPVVGLDPCTLLTEAERAGLGLTRPPDLQGEGTDRRGCFFGARGFSAGITIFDNLGLDAAEASSQDVRPVPAVGTHKALWSRFGSTCGVTMEITKTSTVDASGTGRTDADACDMAMRIAKIIEPKLP